MKSSAMAEARRVNRSAGIEPGSWAFTRAAFFLLVGFLPLGAVCPAEAPGDPGAVNKWPVVLGKPAACSDASPKTLNNGAFGTGLWIGSASNCGPGSYDPFVWQGGSWQEVPLPEGNQYKGGWVQSISDAAQGEPILTLTIMTSKGMNQLGYDTAWVRMPGQPPGELPLPAGSNRTESAVVSANGQYIVGMVSDSGESPRAMRWARNGAGWSAPEYLAPGRAVAVSADGGVVVGIERVVDLGEHFYDGQPWVWMAGSGSGGEIASLESDAMVFDISHTGSMIVGSRPAVRPDCTCECGCVYAVPVYWVPENGGWVMRDLQAIDGLYSVAKAVAEVDGRAIIVGEGYTDDGQGGILRPVAWIPSADGSYGAPLRLEPLGGAFESWAVARDVNRNGVVLGWSDASSTDPTTTAVLWPLFAAPESGINVGHAGAWYNPATAGQGQFIDVEPQSRFIFVSWFTYTPPGSAHPGEPHWFTAQGHYEADVAELVVYETLGGRFDDPHAVSTSQVGEATLRFFDCGLGEMTYRLDHWNVQGAFPLQRVIPGSGDICEQRQQGDLQARDINPGMDGAWYEPETEGQGLFLDVQSDAAGGRFIFVSWFTYGDGTDSGQRWLTAQGSFDGSLAEMDVNETTGGSFDAPGATETNKVGTMTIDFSDCSDAVMAYTLTGEGLAGEVMLTRVIPSAQALCEELAGLD